MSFQTGISTVFRRYNVTVVVAFIVIVLVALSVASIRYFNQLNLHKEQSLTALYQESKKLNLMLEQSVKAVEGIQEFAQYVMQHPEEVKLSVPRLSQQNEMFYLDKPQHDVTRQGKRISSNLTGIGQVSDFNQEKKQELAMAYALTPAFIAAQNIINEATWFYYISFDGFVNIYPWVDRDIWQFSAKTLTNSHTKTIQTLTKENNRVIWSEPYLDPAGSGMNSSVGTGVFHNDELLGTVVIDVNLSRLHARLSELELEDQGLMVYNPNNDILLSKRLGKESLSYRTSWQDLLPVQLKHLNANNLSEIGSSQQIGDWYIEKHALTVNDWTLLKYQKYEDFIAPQYSDFMFVFIMLFIGLLAFLMLINSMTKRTFIKPTTEFIRHIEYCSEGDPGKVTPSSDWIYWFQVVEDIFAQNRSLLLQLTEQNDVLDCRVIEKTQALLESSAKHQRDYALLRSVMDAIPELIVFNNPDGLLMGCNQAFERLTHRRADKMLGQKTASFMPLALADEIERLNAIGNSGPMKQTLTYVGDYIYQGFCNQFTDEEGKTLGSISIFHDVTSQQKTQSALEKAKNQAENANKVKIQFLANMSHEVRTPISAMQGLMDLLANTSLDSRQSHYLQNAQSASKSLLHLVDELLDLSKIEAGKMVVSQAPINLPKVIDKAIKLNITSIDHEKIKLIIELSPSVPSNVICDEMRLVQVIANLFNNAIKFTEKGSIKLVVDALSEDEFKAQVRFSVIDTGIGIAKHKQGHLFNAFSQADESMTRKYGGSGLGLSICQQIIKLLGGEIKLTSELGEGSQLSFVLPLKKVNMSNVEIDDEEELPPELDDSSILAMDMYALKQAFSPSFSETILKKGWSSHHLNHIEELTQLDISASSVLLINESDFVEQRQNSDFINSLTKFKLLCVCQPAMSPLSNETAEHFDKLSLPYLLIDLPLFRYALDQISHAVLNHKYSSISSDQKISRTVERESDLPLLGEPDNEQTIAPELPTSSTVDLNGISILLVEDNLVNQLVARELLLSINTTVTIANNGQEALDLLADTQFDLVFMDIQMPIMDGLTATKNIRKQEKFKDLPVIAMTAHAREEDIQQSLDAGMNLHISKPVTAKVLSTSIKSMLGNA